MWLLRDNRDAEQRDDGEESTHWTGYFQAGRWANAREGTERILCGHAELFQIVNGEDTGSFHVVIAVRCQGNGWVTFSGRRSALWGRIAIRSATNVATVGRSYGFGIKKSQPA